MKINKINLLNFGLFPKASLDAGIVSVINGWNGSGKTTLRNALEWLIPGTARRMSKHNDRQSEKDLIRIGEKKASAEIYFNHQGKEYRIVREVTATTAGIQIFEGGQLMKFEDAKNAPRNADQSDVWALLGFDYNQLTCLFDGRRILEMSIPERKQFYFELAGEKVTEPWLKRILPKHGIEDPQLSPLVERIQKDKFEGAQSWAIEQRKQAKRDKTEAAKIIAPKDEVVSYKSNKLQLHQIGLDAIQKDIAALDTENNELQTKKGSLSVFAAIDVVKLHQEVASLNGEIAEIEKYLGGYKSVSEIEAKLAEQSQEVEQSHLDEDRLNEQIKPLTRAVDRLQEKIKAFQELSDTCPTCEQPIQGDYLKSKIAPLEAELKTETKKLDKLIEQQTAILTRRSELLKLIKSDEKLVPDLQGKEEDLARLKKSLEEKQHIISEKGDQAAKARDDMKDVLAQIQKNDAAKKYVNDLKFKVETYQNQEKAYQEAQTKIKKLDCDIQYYDKLDKLLDPAGPVITEIVSSAIEKVQARLDFLNKFELIDPIKLNSDWTFSIGPKTEGMIDKDGSEWTRISFILSETVAYFLKGLGLFVADGIDIMLPNLKVKFQNMIDGIMDDYESMFIFGSRTKPASMLTEKELEKVDLTTPQKPGWKYFWLENGQIHDIN